MEKYKQIKMKELVKVEDSDEGLILVFQEDKKLQIKVLDGKLVTEFI